MNTPSASSAPLAAAAWMLAVCAGFSSATLGAEPTPAATSTLDNPRAPLSITANRVFSDEFDSAPVSSADGVEGKGAPTRWRTSLWFGSGYSRQGGGQGYYTDESRNSRWFKSEVSDNPFSVDHGILSITARPREIPAFKHLHYTTGILTTINSFYIDYGYFEIRARCPSAPGNWTAFFLYPADDFYNRPTANYTKWEMDFMEILGSDASKIHVTTHQKDSQNAKNSSDESMVSGGRNDDDFHVFGFDKEHGKVNVYRDGTLLLSKPTPSLMMTAGYLCLVLDVGQDGGWAGTPDRANYPQRLLVDYVRVYRTPATTVVGGPFSSQQVGKARTDGE